MKAFVVTAISRVRHTQTCRVRVGAHADHAFGRADFRQDIPSSGEEPRAHLLIHLKQSDNAERMSIIEHRMAKDFGPPLHVHHQESETFFILEGRFRFQCEGQVTEAVKGDTIHMPKGSVHTFRVLSDHGRFLTITNGPFEDMVRAAAQPAETDELPEQLPPTPEQQQALAQICGAHAIDLVGPPIA